MIFNFRTDKSVTNVPHFPDYEKQTYVRCMTDVYLDVQFKRHKSVTNVLQLQSYK